LNNFFKWALILAQQQRTKLFSEISNYVLHQQLQLSFATMNALALAQHIWAHDHIALERLDTTKLYESLVANVELTEQSCSGMEMLQLLTMATLVMMTYSECVNFCSTITHVCFQIDKIDTSESVLSLLLFLSLAVLSDANAGSTVKKGFPYNKDTHCTRVHMCMHVIKNI
jgi:hypothetical protein